VQLTPDGMFLRRTITPYAGQGVIIAMVTILLAFVAVKKTQWDLLWAVALIWALFTSYVVLFGMRYRVSWNDKGLTMYASGGPQRNIPFDEITEIRSETANPDEFLSQARPFRRLVIVGSRRDPSARIDVSLRHFRGADIDNLLAAIRARRPDLVLPDNTMRKARVR